MSASYPNFDSNGTTPAPNVHLIKSTSRPSHKYEPFLERFPIRYNGNDLAPIPINIPNGSQNRRFVDVDTEEEEEEQEEIQYSPEELLLKTAMEQLMRGIVIAVK